MTEDQPPLAIIEPDQLWRAPASVIALVDRISPRVFRRDLSQPGFALIDLGPDVEPAQFRSMLIGFYSALDGIYQHDFYRRLLLRSVGRFDQKVSTEAHLDGAPEESILMLGYEPSQIQSRLSLIDYTRCALDQELTPVEFLANYHFDSRETKEMLKAYATEATPFDSRHYRIAIINNSRLAISQSESGMLGVLHQSTVGTFVAGQSRFISTLLMSPADAWADDLISAENLRSYIEAGSFATG